MRFWHVAAAGVLVAAVVLAPFAASGGGQRATAVTMETTKQTGLPEGVVQRAADSTLALPTGQVYFSQFKYVVGYYGVTSMVEGLAANTARELGRPLSVYVSDFSGTDVTVGPDGLLRLPTSQSTDWVAADDAYFVVDSRARVPTRDAAIVPFSDRADAAAFARAHGGRVERWSAVREAGGESARRSAAAWEAVEADRRDRANATIERARRLLDRPVSVTVEEGESLSAAVRNAPANTTILVTAGNHSVSDVRIRKPVTVRGMGVGRTRIVGDGNRSVFYANASRVALAGFSLSGVGTVRSRAPESVTRIPVGNESFRREYWAVHGYGDAGVVFARSANSLVSNVRLTTEANGVIARHSPGLVVSNLTVYSTKDWQDGFLGVVVLGAPVVVEDSAFYGGKVGVFAHDTASFTVRNATMEGMMIGVFSVYAQGAFVADSTVRDTYVGVYVHDRSNRNVVVDNRLANSENGVLVFGRSSYVAGNVLVHDTYGVVVQGQFSLYRRNVAAFNDVGVRAMSLFPTNRITRNDFAGNRKYAETARFNVLHVWHGNYWRGAPGVDVDGDGYLSRSFRVTGPVGAVAERATGAPTLARAPALQVLRKLQRRLPGLRFGGVVDERPLADPARPDIVERLLARNEESGRYDDEDDWDYTG
ncbi:MAG: NosD domain-containing protein [Halobacterium sp.]